MRSALITLALCACASAAHAADRCPNTEQLAERVIASTVTVLADGSAGIQGSGSGFFIEGGFVVTNWHVVAGSKALRVKLTDQKDPVAATGIVAADLANDLAIVALEPEALQVAKKRALPLEVALPKRGAKVYAFGSPRLLEATMSDGIVSAEREIEGAQRLQMTAAVSPGSSGGPVTDECGAVVGVAYMKVRDSEALNFAIPAHFLAELRTQIGKPRAADVVEREGQARLKSVTATRLGVPSGVDPAQWVQIDPVTQKFFVGIDRTELAGPDFYRHVGEAELLKPADNSVPTLLYAGAGVCGAASVCTCALSVPLFFAGGLGFLTAPIGGLGLCATAGLGGAGFLTWTDAIVPTLTFEEQKKLAEVHNRGLLAKASSGAADDAKKGPKKGAGADTANDAAKKPTEPATVGDPPPELEAPLKKMTATPSVDRGAAADPAEAQRERLSMPY